MLIELRDIHKDFNIEKGLFKQEAGLVRALDGVSLSLEQFQSLGIVGESGCGKTTLAKVMLKLIPATSGEVIFDQRRISNFRKDVQIIFQNPYNSLNPKMRVGEIISEPLHVHRIIPAGKRVERVRDLLNMVGLDRSKLSKYPKEFSGGERQRVCIARALASGPKILVLDEPISSLDLTIQAKLLDLFAELKESLKLTYIFISHNLAVIKHIADSVVVMRQGKIVEEGLKEQIFNNPQHFYTKLLLESAG